MKSLCTVLSPFAMASGVFILAVAAWPAGAAPIQITSVAGFPNGRTSNDSPSKAIDKDINTFTWTTESYNVASPSYLAIGFDSTPVNRLRLWKDKNGGGGQNIKNLTVQYTTDTGPLEARSWTTVSGLSNGFHGAELLKASYVIPNGKVIGDVHNSAAGNGWASLTFDKVTATGLRVSFSNQDPNGSCRVGDHAGFCNHYRVGEFEAYLEPKCATGQEVVIPSSDLTSPTVVLEIRLPDGQTVKASPESTPAKVTAPASGEVTFIAKATDDRGVQDVQLWMNEIDCRPSGCSSPGLSGAPVASNPDASTPGHSGCTERMASYKLVINNTPIRSTSYDVNVKALNFGGKEFRLPQIRLETQFAPPSTPTAREKCLRACDSQQNACMAEVGSPGGPLPRQCVQEFRWCQAECPS